MKRMTAVVLLMCLLLTALPVGVFATETAEEDISIREPGQCGEDLTWSYDSGTLTISGSGAMDDYPDGDAPWLEYKDSIEKLVVTGSVTSIGACAFTDYDNLKDVEFGSAMHSIEYRAFYSCDGLTTFTLPATFRKFGEECFFGCSKLREIRCLGGMPSFKSSCLWDCPVSVFYPTTNPWPAEYVTPLYQSYQGKLQIFMGDGIEEAAVQPTQPETLPAQTEPAVTEPEETIPETTQAETVPTTEATETVPETTAAETTEETKPSWEAEMEELEQQEQQEASRSRGMNGMLIGMILIAATIVLVLIGALVFRRRSY